MQLLDSERIPLQIRQRSTAFSALLGCCAMLLFLCLAAPAIAQYRTSIQGTVADPTGALVPGAKLTLTNKSTNETVVRTSNSAGIFNFNALPADHFTLIVTRDGFKKKVLDDLQLIPEQPNALNVVLEIGADTETVTVNASQTPAMDTETADNGRTISENEIQHMPSFQRNIISLTEMAPGVLSDGAQEAGGGAYQAPGTQTGASSGGGGNLGSSSSIFATESGASANSNGGQFENNGYTVDGISTVSAVWGGATVVTPSQDSIANVKIVTNAYDAENGRFSGAVTEITSKSGTNQLHGSAFIEGVRPGMNAYQRWNGPETVSNAGPNGTILTPEQRGLLRGSDRYNQIGGSLGGPIWKNKIFAFFNYEGQSQSILGTGTGWYATSALAPLAPSGSIASTYLNFPGAAPLGTVISAANCNTIGLAPTGQTSGPECTTVSGGLNIGSPLTTGLGKQDLGYSNSNSPGVGSGLSTVADIAEYSTSNPTSSDFKQYNGRLDADVTSKDHASFAIYWVPASTTTYNGGLGYDLFNHSQINDAFSVIWNHTFGPSFLNEARANAAGWRYNELASNPQAPFGLPQDFVSSIGSISIGQLGPGYPNHLDQWTYGYKDVATKVLRTQTMKFGFDLTQLHYLNVPLGVPQYTFYNLWDFVNDAPEAEGGSFQATTGIPGGYRNDNRMNMAGAFFQDDWRIRPNLTLSAGLRYSYFGPLTDKDNHMGVLSFGSGSALLTGITIRTGIGAWTAQKLNFGPQFGFNWSPLRDAGKLVVRGGYGLNYNWQQIATSNNDDGNPPGTSSIPGQSSGPTQINPNIIYAVSSSPTNYFGYPANKNAITTFTAAGLPTVGNAYLSALPGNMPTQYLEHYSLDTEYDFGHSIIANLGYEGSVGRHLLYNYNAQALGVIQGDPLNPLIDGIGTFGSGGWSMNNMMLAGLKHQFSHTFSAEGQFTWAHSGDTDSGPYSEDAYLYNPKYSYGRSDFDINHTFKAFGVWEPVIFHGSQNWAEKVVGGWSLSGIATFHSGFGWTPVFNDSFNSIYCNTCYQYTNQRPQYHGGAGHSTSNQAFKTGSNFSNPGTVTNPQANNLFSDNYFSVPDYSAAITNNSGQTSTTFIPPPGVKRNSFPGPGYRDVDITFGKSFGLPHMKVLGEGAKLEFKADMLNVFNLLNINSSTISTNIANSNLGQAANALGSRTVDIQARFDF